MISATAPNVDETADETADERDPSALPSGVIAIVVGAAILLYVRGFPSLPNGAPGPALFPGITGGLMVLMGVILVVRGIKNRKQSPVSAEKSEAVRWRGWINAGSVIGATIFYLLAVDFLGFLTTMIAMSILLILRLGAKVWVAITVGTLSTVAIWLIFDKGLKVPLPLGFWG